MDHAAASPRRRQGNPPHRQRPDGHCTACRPIAAIADARSAVTAYAGGQNLEVYSRADLPQFDTAKFGFDRTAAGPSSVGGPRRPHRHTRVETDRGHGDVSLPAVAAATWQGPHRQIRERAHSLPAMPAHHIRNDAVRPASRTASTRHQVRRTVVHTTPPDSHNWPVLSHRPLGGAAADTRHEGGAR